MILNYILVCALLFCSIHNIFAMDTDYQGDQALDAIPEVFEPDDEDFQSECDEIISYQIDEPIFHDSYKMIIKEFPGKTINNIGLLGEERILIELRKKGHAKGKIRAYKKSSLYRQEHCYSIEPGVTEQRKKSHRSSKSRSNSKSTKDRKEKHCIKMRGSQKPGVILGGIDDSRFISHFSDYVDNPANNTFKGEKWITKVYDIINDKLISQFEGCYRARQIKYYPTIDILVFETSNGIDFFRLEGDLNKVSLEGERRFVGLSNNRFASYSKHWLLKINSLDISSDAITVSCLGVLGEQQVGITQIIEIDADRIASCSCDGVINVWSLKDYSCLGEMRHPDIRIDHKFALKMLSDNVIASIGSDNSLKIWDLTNFQCLKSITKYQTSNKNKIVDIECLDNKKLLIFLKDSSVDIYDMLSCELIHTTPQYEAYDCYDPDSGIDKVIKIGKRSFLSMGRQQPYDSEAPEKIAVYRF